MGKTFFIADTHFGSDAIRRYENRPFVATALGILVVKSGTECLLYAQPFPVRAGKNLYAFVADVVMLLVSLPVSMNLDRVAKRMFPELVR